MASPTDRRYTKEHEWLKVDDSVGTVGITEFAQDQLGDIVFVDLPPVGTHVKHLQKFGEIESVKAVSELFSPVTGEVTEVNAALADSPQLVNDSPFEEGWMLKVRLDDPAEADKLLSAAEYDDFVAHEAG